MYGVEDGIPVLLAGSSTEQLARQAAYFDESVDVEFEIERPRGTPVLHGWLLAEKFRRSISGLEELLAGATVLTVCSGSGMDSEFLARAGANVIAADISLGAARRTLERARRHGVEIEPIVADVQRLPFRDRSVEVVYVHDGLHHLERPAAGLAEMARVAALAISVNEPAQAGLTSIAVRIGLALSDEPAGNRVERLDLGSVAEQLAEHGFRIVEASRYGMYYRHEPGAVASWLSRPRLFPLTRAAFLGLNRVGGGLGNKLTVKGQRRRLALEEGGRSG